MKTVTFEDALSRVVAEKSSIDEAVNMLVGRNGVKVGGHVAVINDPTFPFEGQTGTVKAIKEETGMADVEFGNGSVVPLQLSLLIPVD